MGAYSKSLPGKMTGLLGNVGKNQDEKMLRHPALFFDRNFCSYRNHRIQLFNMFIF